MRRRDVSPEELARIVNLRQINTSWLKIQRDIGVPRRIAKRAYESWNRSQSREELKEARKVVAAEEFRIHLACLVKLAEALVKALAIPEPTRPPISAEENLRILLWESNILWESDIAREYGIYGPAGTSGSWNYLRQNQILFKSLQSHTHEKVDWQMLEQWKKTWDECIRVQDVLRQKARRMLLDILEQKTGLTDRIEKGSKEKGALDRMANGVLHTVWQGVLAGKPDQPPLVEAVALGDEVTNIVFGDDHRSLGLVFTEVDLAKKVKDACIHVAKNLVIVKEEDLGKLVEDVHRMKQVIDKLTEMLNPLMLHPQILHTRCDLCPA